MNLLLRADGDRARGGGHVLRLLALAQGARSAGGRVALASAQLDPELRARVEREGVECIGLGVPGGTREDAEATVAAARGMAAAWVVADGYGLGVNFQPSVARAFPLALVDDFGRCGGQGARLTVDANVGASAADYGADVGAILIGPKYALLRREIAVHDRARDVEPPRADRILITMGATDPQNLTGSVLAALAPVAGLVVRVLVGPGNPAGAQLREAAMVLRAEILTDVDNVAPAMGWADLAIAAAGTTATELCHMGVPALLVVAADNQRRVASALDRLGAARSLGTAEDLTQEALRTALADVRMDAPLRARMSATGQGMVDGQGVARVLDAMRSLS